MTMLKTLSTLAAVLAVFSGTALAGEIKPVFIGESERAFSRPHDVAIAPTGLYLVVADLGNDAVKVLDPGRLKVLAAFGQGELSSPHDVAFGKDERLYVADTGNDRIMVYTFKGVFRDGSANAEHIETYTQGIVTPEGVAEGSNGRVYVANTGAGSIVALEAGRVIKTVEAAGGTPLARPHDIHVGPEDRVYLAGSGNHRVLVFDRDLNLLSELKKPDYAFNEPKYVATDEDGTLFLADEYNHQIKIFDADFRQVGTIGSGTRGDGPDGLNGPEGVDVAGRYLWISDTHNHRIMLFKTR